MKNFLESEIAMAISLALLIATIQGCRYINVKIDQLKAKAQQQTK